MSTIQAVDKWHKTRSGHLAFALIELALAYAFGSWAIDTGSTWQYVLTFVFLIGGVQNLIRTFHRKK